MSQNELKPADVSVLVADQDEAQAQELAKKLSHFGYDVYHAKDLSSITEVLKVATIETLVCDTSIADTSASENLLSKWQSSCASLRSVILTSSDDVLDPSIALKCGAVGILPKPLDAEVLAEFILSSLKIKGQSKELRGLRFPVKARVECRLLDSNLEIVGETHNISRGGMFLIVPRPLPDIGREFSFHISFDNQTITGHCVVRWLRELDLRTQPPGIGVEFFDVEALENAKFWLQLSKQRVEDRK